ncbi:MAG: type II toxin-antitoxin system VapC family toxin [Actinomycetota bacterium]
MKFADTGFWFGLHVSTDRRHKPAAALWRADSARIVTSNLILGETWTLARVRGVGHRQALELIDAIQASSRVEVVRVDAPIERQAWDWLRLHDERRYSFVDATSFTVMLRRRIHEALTFDGDFASAGFVELRA